MSSGVVAELAAAGFDEPQEIGRGGFGVVYRCLEYGLERYVAVKVLLSEVQGDERERFVREQHALGRLSGHPHIVQVLSVDVTASGRPYFVMPYFAQGSLDRVLHAAGPLRWPEVLSIGVKMAGALAAAHALGIVHRDVKPGNILLTDYGEPQLSDFGIAEVGQASAAISPMIEGTPAFTAPEVLRGHAPTPAADVYGLGATLFCLLTGHSPFHRGTGEPLEVQLARIMGSRLPNLRDYGVPDAVCVAIEAAMAVDPADRPASATTFGEQLRDVQRRAGQPIDVMAAPADLIPHAEPRGALPSYSAGSVSTPPPPFASTKFRPPTAPRTAVERTRLLEILRRSGRRRLILVHGPAGFGKTTLAAQWAQEVEAAGTPVAWLTTDPDDDNVVWFLTHLVEAIRRVRPELARELGALLEARSSDATRSVLSALIDEIHDSGTPMLLVVDDWQQVHGRRTVEAMDYLLRNGCHHLRVLVTGRNRSGLPLATLRVQDELVEIDAAALRFDTGEARTFLVDRNGLELDAKEVDKVRQSTEGWAAGLQLAQLSLNGRDDPAGFIDNLTGRYHVIGEYLAENVLDSLDPALLDFLMATTVTSRIRADLAVALSGRSDSQELLQQIADRNLFLQRLDDTDEWFRYHRLFADHLQRKLTQQAPDRVTALHARASTWFAERDMLVEAVDHALAAGEADRAVDLVESHTVGLVQDLRMATFLGLMAKLPRHLTESRPRLQLGVAWANCGMERTDQVRFALDRVLALVAESDLTEEEALALRMEAAVVASLDEYMRDRFEKLPDILADNADRCITPIMGVAIADLASAAALNRYDYDAVEQWFRTAVRCGAVVGPVVLQHSHCLAGLAALERFDIAAAEMHYTAPVRVPRNAELGVRLSLEVGALLADLRYRQNRLDEADQLLRAASTLNRQAGAVDFMAATYIIGARVAVLRGDRERAERLLTIGAQLAVDKSTPRMAAAVVAERVRAGLPVADDVRDRLLNRPPYRRQDNRIRAVTAELEEEAAIRLLLATGTPEDTAAACRRAETMVREIESQPRPKALVQAQLLYACCLWANGQRDEAKALVRPALTLCTEHGVIRLVLDGGPGIDDILASLVDRIG
ncbi:serine/threonine-protein kinase [Nocardia sp. alder85J]|uniref:serine/threonine-protein kinase n=1 Tax=Nocardia sp. alder85J TaxID=2862949 RepID=UPI001CD3EB56|nr:serine/threonine-protein kinase [Nocardia sp. alder85J]MCX4092321.1 protein kinase [Nocardia sp. alder85J]